jgi:BirA family biotin operon repressor/biotin-[acetyl-CoA-carboxylase] ligase
MGDAGATWHDPRPAGDPLDRGGFADPPDRWSAGWHVTVVDETGSTNSDLLTLAGRGAPHRSVLAARHQTAGRGRLDRRWEAPPGANLLVSMLFREVPEHPNELTRRVALAAVDAVAVTAGVPARLKWPNDVLVDGAKLAGVLAQAGVVDGRVDHVVVGIGINVGWAPDGGARVGDGVHPLRLLGVLLEAYDALPADVHARYREALVTLGQRVRVERATDVLEGRAVDVEPDGRLVVVDACAVTHRLDTGDVVHLRPAAG